MNVVKCSLDMVERDCLCGDVFKSSYQLDYGLTCLSSKIGVCYLLVGNNAALLQNAAHLKAVVLSQGF